MLKRYTISTVVYIYKKIIVKKIGFIWFTRQWLRLLGWKIENLYFRFIWLLYTQWQTLAFQLGISIMIGFDFPFALSIIQSDHALTNQYLLLAAFLNQSPTRLMLTHIISSLFNCSHTLHSLNYNIMLILLLRYAILTLLFHRNVNEYQRLNYPLWFHSFPILVSALNVLKHD